MDKETNSRGRALVVPVAVVAGLGMAGVGLALSGVARAATTDVRSSTDTLNVNVQLSCTFNSVENKTYTGSANNGAEVGNFNDSGAHEFNFSCNDKDGYTVSATPYDLEATGIEDVIAYTDSYAPSGANGMWTAAISSNTAGVTVTPVVPVGGGTIISASSNTAAGGTTFTATYSAYVGTEMPAGTYSGTIVYTLISPGLSNGGGSGTGSGEINQNDNGGGSGTGENGGGNGNGNNGGGSGTNDDNSGSGTGDSGGTNSGDPNDAQNGTQSLTPQTLNSTYNTYNTTNTYNTNNYSGGGTSTPIAATTQGTTSGSGSSATNSNSSNKTGTGDNYEKPLGVTTGTTKTTSESSGMDPMPIIVGGALAAAGVVAVVLAKKDKEEEKE